jgi:transposase
MINIMDKHSIIKLKLQDHSDRSVERLTGINRKTVAKHWKDYQHNMKQLKDASPENIPDIQEMITGKPKYDSSGRGPRKYTEGIDNRLEEILAAERLKDTLLGNHKQRLTAKQIHALLKAEGYDIGYTTITLKINEKLDKKKECFIRQEYDLGDRLEYDFGEVKLIINDVTEKLYMAVFSSPGGDFRWGYLYTNQKKPVFMDSHVLFFEMVGGVYREVVYDNMKNVVSRFIGRNEKELNEDLVGMSVYYGFEINVTNCFKGNEKGHVESSVKILRNQIFADEYRFSSLEEAREHMHKRLLEINVDSKIAKEKECLLPYRPKLELAKISEAKVNKYSFIRVDNNFYSVPDYLVGRKVSVKAYHDRLRIYSKDVFVCDYERTEGKGKPKVDISHYLDTFLKKPGAVKNSLALKSIPRLKNLFDNHFSGNPKKFILLLRENHDKHIDEVISIIQKHVLPTGKTAEIDYVPGSISENTRQQLKRYSDNCVMGGA